MIDYEVKIFNRAQSKGAPLCASGKFVSTPIVDDPTKFPAASLYEANNTTVRSRMSSTPVENYAAVMWQLDVYATSKAKCKEVASAVDEEMISMNFIRVSGQFIPNLANPKIPRYTARYEAWIDRDGNIYRPS